MAGFNEVWYISVHDVYGEGVPMTSSIPPSGGSGDAPYKAQYQTTAAFRQFWEHLFRGAALTDQQVSQMTDTFVKNVCDQMNQVLQWALQQQKERDQKQQEEEG